ncbi:MAG: hypothetical protein QXR50_05480 [Archaeoglobaceae archaeon]
MKIESIKKDKCILFDENERKRIKVKLIRNARESFTVFNPVEKIYEIHITTDEQLLHEAHHLFKPCLRPVWLALEIFDIEEDFPEKFCRELNSNYLLNFLKKIYPEIAEEIKNDSMELALYFQKSMKKSPSYKLCNIFEDLAIEEHLNLYHNHKSKHKIYRKSVEYLEKILKLMKVNSVEEIQRKFLHHNPFTQIPLCEYSSLNLDKRLAERNNFGFREYYDSYLRRLRSLKKEGFAEQYRINLEIKRVEKIRSMKDWEEAENFIIKKYIECFQDLFQLVLGCGSKTQAVTRWR